MAAGLSLQTRRVVLQPTAPAYREAPLVQKRVLLDEFLQTQMEDDETCRRIASRELFPTGKMLAFVSVARSLCASN